MRNADPYTNNRIGNMPRSSPDALSRRSLEQAAANDRAILLAIAAAGTSGIRPGRDLARTAGMPERTARAALARLIDRRLVWRAGKRRVWASTEGQKEAGIPQRAPAIEHQQLPRPDRGEPALEHKAPSPAPPDQATSDLSSLVFSRARTPATAARTREAATPLARCTRCQRISPRLAPLGAAIAFCPHCASPLEPK
jgi:hypothetical protein